MLLGFGAYAIDTARIYIEHSELRNGADAAAFAVAAECAEGACGDVMSNADFYADANAGDDAAWIQDVAIDHSAQTVRVQAATEEVGGDHVLDMVLAQVIGYNGLTVDAESTVAWGSAGSVTGGFPLAFSKCEWDEFGVNGFVDEYEDGFLHRSSALEYGFAPYEGKYVTIYFHGSAGTEECPGSPSGQDLPGGFGWLVNSGLCSANYEVGEWVAIDPGASPTNTCTPEHVANQKVVGIPYFSDTRDQGSGGEYYVHGIGVLHVTGYNFGGQYKQSSSITNKPVCKGELRCIEGYMMGDYTLPNAGIGGPDLGGIALELRN